MDYRKYRCNLWERLGVSGSRDGSRSSDRVAVLPFMVWNGAGYSCKLSNRFLLQK